MSLGLTSRQADCLRFLTRYMRENDGVSPAFSEILEALGVSSKSAAHRLLTGLEERGYIRRLPHRARAIDVLRPAPGEEPADFSDRLSRLDDDAFARVAKAVLAEGQRRAGGRA